MGGCGGDIHRKVVVTEVERLEAKRAALIAELSRIEDRLTEIGTALRR